MIDNVYDILIIGGGPAGLTAGIYAARSGLHTLLLEKMGCGGQSAITDWLENYPGFPEGIAGYELSAVIEAQAKKFNVHIILDEVKELRLPSHGSHDKIVITAGHEYHASAVIIATGTHHKLLGVHGETSLRGKGVSYCATCDGPFFRDKVVMVVGGGNSAVQEAIYLTRFARTVTIIHRRERLRATHILQHRAKENPKIKFLLNSIVTAIKGDERVASVSVKNIQDNSEQEMPCDGVFVFVGIHPNTSFLEGVLKLDDLGYVITDQDMRTSAQGVFACGDVRQKLLRQVVTAVGEGATAAHAAQEFVDEIRGTPYK